MGERTSVAAIVVLAQACTQSRSGPATVDAPRAEASARDGVVGTNAVASATSSPAASVRVDDGVSTKGGPTKWKDVALPAKAVGLVSNGLRLCAALEGGGFACGKPGGEFALVAGSSGLKLLDGRFGVTSDGTVIEMNEHWMARPIRPLDPPVGKALEVADLTTGLCRVAPSSEVICRDLAVPGLRGAVDVDAGLNAVCALLSNGRVSCWPDSEGDRALPPKPAPVAGVSDALALAATGRGDSFCALRRGHLLTCWGTDRWRDPFAIEEVQSFVGGTCAVLVNGGLAC